MQKHIIRNRRQSGSIHKRHATKHEAKVETPVFPNKKRIQRRKLKIKKLL
jgi:hypothetical protein